MKHVPTLPLTMNHRAFCFLRGQGSSAFVMPDAGSPLSPTPEGLGLDLSRAFEEVERQGRRGILLLGPPGTGKTFACERIRSERPGEEFRKIDCAPFQSLPLSERARAAEAELAAVLSRLPPRSASRPSLVVDGLDRLGEAGERRAFLEKLRNRIDAPGSPEPRIAITCTDPDGCDILAPDFLELHLSSPTLSEILSFGTGLSAALRAAGHPLGRLPDLLDTLDGPSWRTTDACGILRHPFLFRLALLLAVHGERVPRSRPELLAKARNLNPTASVAALVIGCTPTDGMSLVQRLATPVDASGEESTDSGIEFVSIPGGQFEMGSAPTEMQRWDDEGPVRQVKVKAFALSKTPITNSQFLRFLAECPEQPFPPHMGDPRYNAADQPVTSISWKQARDFAEWAGACLPSEAQWEYACRAGTTGPRYGDLDQISCNESNSGGSLPRVASRQPNAFGLHDMLGCVWEWVEDDHHPDYHHAPSGDAPWIDRPRSEIRILRGGSWADNSRTLRAATRLKHHPGPRIANVGFRIAKPVPVEPQTL